MEHELTLDGAIVSAVFHDSMDMGVVGTTAGTLWYVSWAEGTSTRLISGHRSKVRGFPSRTGAGQPATHAVLCPCLPQVVPSPSPAVRRVCVEMVLEVPPGMRTPQHRDTCLPLVDPGPTGVPPGQDPQTSPQARTHGQPPRPEPQAAPQARTHRRDPPAFWPALTCFLRCLFFSGN